MEELLTGFGLVEGPRVDGDGGLWFSDVLAGGVHRRATDGAVALVVPKRRGVGGLALHADGGIVASGRDLVHVRDGTTRTLLALDGVTGFNDLVAAPDGSVIAGALRYRPMGEDPVVPGELWRVATDGTAAMLVAGIDWANGIGLAPDGRRLYVSDYASGRVLTVGLDASGAATGALSEFARSPRGSADGLAVDEEGGVWIALGAGGGVARFAGDGALDRVVDVPADFVSSLCFGGPDRRDLYVTTIGGAFRTRSDVPGLAIGPARV